MDAPIGQAPDLAGPTIDASVDEAPDFAVPVTICYMDVACYGGNQSKARDQGSGQCVDVSTCSQLWKCSQGPVSGCGGGSQDCVISPG